MSIARQTYITFALLILTWVVAWTLKVYVLDSRFTWLNTSLGGFAFWTLAKLIVWILPALWLIRLSGRAVGDVLNVSNWKSAVAWGLGIGLVIASTAMVPRVMRSQPIESERSERAPVVERRAGVAVAAGPGGQQGPQDVGIQSQQHEASDQAPPQQRAVSLHPTDQAGLEAMRHEQQGHNRHEEREPDPPRLFPVRPVHHAQDVLPREQRRMHERVSGEHQHGQDDRACA